MNQKHLNELYAAWERLGCPDLRKVEHGIAIELYVDSQLIEPPTIARKNGDVIVYVHEL